jgi:autophagy-related protein 5
VPLKWQHPLGLLYDTLSGAVPAFIDDRDINSIRTTNNLPWKLELHFSNFPADILLPLDPAGKIHYDAYINSVKEADFLRNGSAKVMMSLGKDDSNALWRSVQEHNLALFNTINQKFLKPPAGQELRHVPLKIYLPSAAVTNGEPGEEPPLGTLKVVQSLVAPMVGREPQTIGGVLHELIPTVFPSRRTYIFAHAVLHGAVLPLAASVEDLMRSVAYTDGFLHISLGMIG